MHFDLKRQAFVGNGGVLSVPPHDEVARKLAMLLEGRCGEMGPSQAVQKHGDSKQRYFQLLRAFEQQGTQALVSKPRGPKRNYRRTDELVRQVIRHCFLDPQASAEVVAQKLRQTGFVISTGRRATQRVPGLGHTAWRLGRVQRVIADFGLQKKLYACRPKQNDTPTTIETRVSLGARLRVRCKILSCHPLDIERGVRRAPSLLGRLQIKSAATWQESGCWSLSI